MMRKTVGAFTTSALIVASSVAFAQSRDPGQAIQNYQQQAAGLLQQRPNPKHPAEIKAMRTLADAFDAIPGAPADVGDAAKKIRDDADKLQSSPVTDPHSEFAKDALTNAANALNSVAQSCAKNVQALPDRIAAARATVDRIDPNENWLKERETIDRAFQQVGDALGLVGQQPGVACVPSEEQQRVAGQEEQAPPPEQPPPPPEGQTTIVTPPPPAPVVAPETQAHKWFSTQLALDLGGGYNSFGAKGLRDITQNGGEWDFHLVVGAHSPVALEGFYAGSANQLNGRMPGVDNSAVIVSSQFAGDIRVSTPALRMIPVQLFGFAGAGYNRFTLTNKSFNTGVLANSDNTFLLPLGGGLQVNISDHWVLDGRFTYDAVFDENLFGRTHNADMYSATGRFGYVF